MKVPPGASAAVGSNATSKAKVAREDIDPDQGNRFFRQSREVWED
jgi:hypothetical protein